MNSHRETPFDSIENAHEYIRMLQEVITEARADVAVDLAAASDAKADRRLEALRLVHYKLEKLEQHLLSSSRTLNDLRSLRRLLFEERTAAGVAKASKGPEAA